MTRILLLLLIISCQSTQPSGPTYQQAEKLFEQQKFVEASQMLSKLLDQEPTLPGARNLLARCFFFLGNPDRSFEELEFILQNSQPMSEASLDAMFLMGAITLEATDLNPKNEIKGRKAWVTYLKVSPSTSLKEKVKTGLVELEALDNPPKATVLARSYIQSSNIPKALHVFRRILRKNPKYVPAWHYQGMAYIMQGEPKSAVASWRQVFKLDSAYAKRFKLDQRIAVAEKME